MMNLEQQICDRLFQSLEESNSKTKVELLKSCKLQMIVVENSSALLIRCPNSWTARRVGEFLIGYLDRVLHSMGIDRAVIDDGERMKAYYEWDITNFALRGHFLDGDKFIPIPSDEDLGIF